MTVSEMDKTALLCVTVAIWPKHLSPGTRLTTSPGARGQPGLGSKKSEITPSARSTWMGHMSSCSPGSLQDLRAEESPVGPSRSLLCLPVPVEVLSGAGSCQADCQGGAGTTHMPAASGRSWSSGMEPCE